MLGLLPRVAHDRQGEANAIPASCALLLNSAPRLCGATLARVREAGIGADMIRAAIFGMAFVLATVALVQFIALAGVPLPRDPYGDPRFAYRLAGAADRLRLNSHRLNAEFNKQRLARVAQAHAAALRRAAILRYKRHRAYAGLKPHDVRSHSSMRTAHPHATTPPQRRHVAHFPVAHQSRRLSRWIFASSVPETLRWYGWGKL
jgi:hypothetical protein